MTRQENAVAGVDALQRMNMRCDQASSEANGAWRILVVLPHPWPAEAMDVWDRLERRASRRQRAWTRLFMAQRRVAR